ncbi:MAG TPA: class D beta-lactamase [Noviherbaspirillum sp.]|uniref:class D beta-lactamase n=1 Tax=Noviherbaspirillum sp. TaxID=1926288 RepID=UPI002F946237
MLKLLCLLRRMPRPLAAPLAALALAATVLPGHAAPRAPQPLSSLHAQVETRFREAGVKGAFVLLDAQGAEVLRYNPERARQRFLPASTFKIPNTLIALETGVADGPGHAMAWDPEKAPRKSWWPAAWAGDHELQSALKHSVVWYYQELARRIGPARMQAWLDRFDYGNRDISGGIDRFWLDGGLRISPDEEAAFLRRFYFGELGLSARTTALAKDMLVLEQTPDYRLSGKTGWVALGDDQPQTGWLVGYVEQKGKVHFFATNIDIVRNADAAQRVPMTKAILRDLGLLP